MKNLNVFFYVKKKGKKGKGPQTGTNAQNPTRYCVFGKIQYKGTETTFSTGEFIDLETWNRIKALPGKGLPESLERIVNNMNDSKTKISDAAQLAELLKEKLTAEEVKNRAFAKERPVKTAPKRTILQIYNEVLEDKIKLMEAGQRSQGSITKYTTVQGHLESYHTNVLKRKDTPLDELDYKFIKGFYMYLLSGPGKTPIANNTSQKYVQAVRGSILYAIKAKYILTDPFSLWDYEWNEVDTVYLTEEELTRIEKHVFDTDRLSVVRDIFVFSCYTGYAPVDLKYITYDKIELRSDGENWFNMRRHKVDTKSDVMLLPKVEELIEKYKTDPICRATKQVMPYRANQTMNEYLKEIATLCSISKNLTHYVARHTYATTIMLGNGASKEVTGRTMGHKKSSQTDHYAKVVDSKVSREMKAVKAKLNSQKNPLFKFFLS